LIAIAPNLESASRPVNRSDIPVVGRVLGMSGGSRAQSRRRATRHDAPLAFVAGTGSDVESGRIRRMTPDRY
jgi:hypothetical protein